MSVLGSDRDVWSGRGGAGLRARVVRAVLAVLVVVAVVAVSSSSLKTAYTYAAISAVGAVALTVLQGWAGQGSLFVAGLFLIGGYATAAVPRSFGSIGVLLGLLLAAAVGAAFGVLCSMPARRLTGVYLLLGTLALQYMVNDAGDIFQSSKRALGGFSVGTALLTQYEWLFVTGLLLVAAVSYFRSLGRSRVGRAAVLIRNDAGLAQVSGVAVTKHIRWMFVVTSAVMALAGAVETYYTTTVSYDAYGVTLSVQFLVMIVVLGLGSLWGAVGGSFFVIVLTQVLSQTLAGSNGISGNAAYVVGLIYGSAGFLAVLFLSRTGGPAAVPLRRESPPTRDSLRARMLTRRWHLLAERNPRSGVRGLRRTEGSTQPDAANAPVAAAISGERATPSKMLDTPFALQAGRREALGVNLRDVSIYYGGAEAVANVDLQIEPGATLALVGRNGAGKTSLLLSVVGFPTDSKARVSRQSRVSVVGRAATQDISHLSAARRTQLGMAFVPADGKVFASLTVHEHLVMVAKKARRPLKDVEALLEVFADLRLALGRQAGLLSGGQKQQLALLCALAGRPAILVVDELTLGLSPSATERVIETLIRARAEDHPTLVLAEQSVAVAFELANRVALIENGRLVACETPSTSFESTVRRAYVGMSEVV